MKKVAYVAAGVMLAAALGSAQAPAPGTPQQAPAPGTPQQAGGRGGPPRSCNPNIPAAECSVGAPPINWAAPDLPAGPIAFESAMPQHRNLRLVVMARLAQPWSMAFLPDNVILVTERGGGSEMVDGKRVPITGRLRVVRNGVLDPTPVAGVPQVRSAGLQGLMDVVLHPRFAENRVVYLSYHKPVPARSVAGTTPAATNAGAVQPQTPTPQVDGATTIARGTWNGTALVDVKDIWPDPQAVRTEASRIGFGRDGMLYMSISASGTGPDVMRSADPNDLAGKTIRLRDDGTVPPDNPFVNRPATGRRSTRSATATATRCSSIRRPASSG